MWKNHMMFAGKSEILGQQPNVEMKLEVKYYLIKVIKREKKTANSMDPIMLTVILSKMVSALHGKGLMCQFQQKVLID